MSKKNAYISLVALIALLLAIWGGLVLGGLAPVAPFIAKLDWLVGLAVTGLTVVGTNHLSQKKTAAPPAAPVAPPAAPSP